MALSKRLKSTGLALLVLIVPGVCYLVLQTGTNYYQRLPVYGAEKQRVELADIPDSAWHRVNLSRIAAQGTAIPDLEGNMYVAGFFRIEASPAAETLAVNMARVARIYRDMDRLRFVTFVADKPADSNLNASQPSMEPLLDQYLGTGGNRIHVRLPEATLRDILREEFLLWPASSGEKGKPLNDTLVLVDSRLHIRGFYRGNSYFDTDTLKDEIAVLWKEEMNRDDQE
ncbi:MAG: hypothetical protein FWJ85_01750 [Solitalea sp.]